jgi:hypothetical protein
MAHWQPTPQEMDELLAYAAVRGVSVKYDSGYLEILPCAPDPTVPSKHNNGCLAPNLLQAKLCIDRFCKP